ncbi:hypothetical protein FK513_32440, partial [Klebsiella pneumoniae]|nr:hypothetical protein [Klebsiella pneumoniae]
SNALVTVRLATSGNRRGTDAAGAGPSAAAAGRTGEEIGMTNPHFSSISDYRDVESHNMFIERA